MLKRDLVRIKACEKPNGYQHEEKVWEVKDNLRKKMKRERNHVEHSHCPSRRGSSVRRTSGTNIAEIGLEFLTNEYFLNKM